MFLTSQCIFDVIFVKLQMQASMHSCVCAHLDVVSNMALKVSLPS